MPFPSTTPYDILEVAPTATLNDIMQAYQQALRRRKFSAPQITQAFNDLRNARRRAEHDLLVLTRLGDQIEAAQYMRALRVPPVIQEYTTPIPVSVALTDIGRPPTLDDSRAIPQSPLQFSLSAAHENLGEVLPPLPYPS